MRVGLVSGDGLPVSGLLTIFRNVLDVGVAEGLIEWPVPADLGYSWRPDKGDFFPAGAPVDGYPPWLTVVDSSGVAESAEPEPDTMWQQIRAQVARASTLSRAEQAALSARIDRVAAGYEAHFSRWMWEGDIDWVIAVNMTLSDAVPVTAGLHRAARARYGGGRRPGGVVFWDHDLFRSCAVFEDGQRVYPTEPNDFTPLPGAGDYIRWVVISAELADEANQYPTAGIPRVIPNVLPTVGSGPLEARHAEFVRQRGLESGRPLLLAPVRVFRIKGVEISIELLAAAKAECRRRGLPTPYLLVFGSLQEDPVYAQEVVACAERLGVTQDVVFLGGVPLGSYADGRGNWRLDEVDLLRLAASTGGLVLFTPNVPDVETIGLGPALAACAGMPSVVTAYDAFERVYGPDFRCLSTGSGQGRLADTAVQLVQAIYDARARTDAGGGAANQAVLRRVFPSEGWRGLLHEMAGVLRQPTGGPALVRATPDKC
jgi:hypothetical protein